MPPRDEKSFTQVGGNERVDVYRTTEYGQPKIWMHARFGHDERATLAIGLVERWGLIAGIIAGEDSAGRQKLDLMPVPDLVERACSTAQAMHDAFAERGWSFPIPLLDYDPSKDNQ